MGDKLGKDQRPVWQHPKERGSFVNGRQENETVRNGSSAHGVSKESSRLAVEQDFARKHYARSDDRHSSAKERGSFANGRQEEDETVRNGSAHRVSRESSGLLVKRDFTRKHQYSPYGKSDDRRFKEKDEKILSRYSSPKERESFVNGRQENETVRNGSAHRFSREYSRLPVKQDVPRNHRYFPYGKSDDRHLNERDEKILSRYNSPKECGSFANGRQADETVWNDSARRVSRESSRLAVERDVPRKHRCSPYAKRDDRRLQEQDGKMVSRYSSLKDRRSFANGHQEDETVRNGSARRVSRESSRVPVKQDVPRNHQYSPYARRDDRRLKEEDEKILSRYSNNVQTGGAIRDKVMTILKLYREILAKHLRENNKSIHKKNNIHKDAADELQNTMDFLNSIKRIGAVPGVKIGDEFGFRAEMYIVGLHRQYSKGIDSMKNNGLKLAVSVASSDRYENTLNSHGELIYTGEGRSPRDQKLTGGNRALYNSMDRKTPVRVIRKCTIGKTYSYVYDGLHMVERCWHEKGLDDNLVYKFQFRRVSGQPIHAKGFPLLDKQSVIINEDLSGGKEKFAIAVVNTIDDEGSPGGFSYTAEASIDKDNPRIGCDCVDCSESQKECCCIVENGKKIRYDYDECIGTKRPFIYECGPYCKCFESCINRVSQRGIRLKLEVFKTESKGWGVRSTTHIPRGKFVCQYVGDIVKFEEGISDNEYLFIIENNAQFGEKQDLAINAAEKGNVGRFINHSCSANLHVQYVYIGPESKVPHIMLFAKRDIKPFEELTFDYNLRLGCMKNWVIKVKKCKCGSSNCCGKFS